MSLDCLGIHAHRRAVRAQLAPLALLVAWPAMWPAFASAATVAIATGDAAAPVPSRLGIVQGPLGISDAAVVAVADPGGVWLSNGTAVASYGDLVPGFGRLSRFESPAVNSAGDVVFVGSNSLGPNLGSLALLRRSGDLRPHPPRAERERCRRGRFPGRRARRRRGPDGDLRRRPRRSAAHRDDGRRESGGRGLRRFQRAADHR
jgi:hypothetical protein